MTAHTRVSHRRRIAAGLAMWLLACAGIHGQAEHMHPRVPDPPRWTWTWDGNVFVGWNYQLRKFRDFQKIESQNWFMVGGDHALARGRLRLFSMLSLEPFTIQALGSPQVFQTGETYQKAPLIDYQHPHDLFMALGAAWTRTVSRMRVFAELAPVGSPAIGPPAFMHRPSADGNPTAPLGHHQMDATHISHGVVTGGLSGGAFALEGSWFRGAEPDENRKDIELGKLDSYAGRVSWRRGAWDAQVSGAHLTRPEYVEPFFDVTRITASVGYTRADGRGAGLLSWGQNREIHGVMDAYLVEGTMRTGSRHTWYARAELATKDILSPGGRHPPGFVHFHPLSRVGALTGGYTYQLGNSRAGQFGVGGDATVYHVADNLLDNYGSPASVHVFLRYRPRSRMPHDMAGMR